MVALLFQQRCPLARESRLRIVLSEIWEHRPDGLSVLVGGRKDGLLRLDVYDRGIPVPCDVDCRVRR